MRILSVSPLPAGSLAWQPREGAFALTVICKATFRLAPGECALADVQDPLCLEDCFEGSGEARILRAPSDFVPEKRRVDVLLVGRAYAPGGKPVRSLTAWLVAGKVDKETEVDGDRRLTLDGQQVEEISDVERIVLSNLHPAHPRLVTKLPGLRPRAFMERPGQPPAEVSMKADTLWLDTDRALCTLTWRGQVPLETKEEPGRVLIAMEKRGDRGLEFDDVEALAPPFEASAAEPSAPELVPPPEVPLIAKIAVPTFALRGAAGERAPPPPEPFVEPPARVPSPVRAVRLLWFEPAFMARIRQVFRPLLAPEAGADELDLLGILRAGQPVDAAGLDGAMDAAFGSLSCFRPPLVLADGDLRFALDDAAMLEAMLGAAVAFAAVDAKLGAVVGAVRELLQAPWFRPPAGVSRELARRIGANAAANRILPEGYLEAQAGRALLERRRYQRLRVLEGEWIRARLSSPRIEADVPAYLPAALLKVLPMLQSMPVRLIAEARPRQDQHEPHAVALRVVALGWVVGARC